MCGFAGLINIGGEVSEEQVRRMGKQISHRGPDGFGEWSDRSAGIAMAHVRLAIVDLSEAGRQPMMSVDKRLVIVFNGMIYNHREIRDALNSEGWDGGWRGHSDTETLLAALQIWGVSKTLSRITGMFAFALWDRERQVLSIARDRMGEKPLYYGTSGHRFLFGSELKALRAAPGWTGEIDEGVVASYFRHNYVPDPHCIYHGIHKLAPAHWVEVIDGVAGEPKCYWDFSKVVCAERRTGSPKVLINQFEQRLERVIARQMDVDVPLGAFLSGGIDSSLIVALMQKQSSVPIRTFTIGFDVGGFNEAEHAKAVAEHLGTDHTELYLSPQDALNVVPELPRIWDEPFADSSQIPTFLLSRMTREHVTVSLSGDGGDEVFCGYNRYGRGYDLHQKATRLPAPVRGLLSKTLACAPGKAIDALMQLVPKRYQLPAVTDRLQKLSRVLSDTELSAFYKTLISQFQTPGLIVQGAEEAKTILARPEDWPALEDFREVMMFLDSQTYLPGDILTKVDRATMANSLEARVPFLDHGLIEFAWTLPLDMKARSGAMKFILRELLDRHVPRNLFDRPKMGFGIPIEHWLSGPLKEWAGDLLSSESLRSSGLLNESAIRALWDEHVSGRVRHHHQIWTILMFQSWLLNERSAKG